MFQSNSSGKNSIVGIVVASVCIFVYIGALLLMVVRINNSMEQQRRTAEQEFFDLADKAISAGAINFMDDIFIETIQRFLKSSKTLEGVIINFPGGEQGFERVRGKALYDANGSPRFRNRIDFSQEMFQHLQIKGVSDVTIRAKAAALDSADLIVILKQALFLVAAALILAFFALLMDSLWKKRNKAFFKQKAKKSSEGYTAGHGADGSYSERGRIVREENTESRLVEELRRCVQEGQDLTFIVIEYKPTADETFYARFAADAARFFSSRDFVCEKGEQGVSVICPGFNLDTGFLNADEFHNRIVGKYPGFFTSKTDLCVGLSSRSERPVNAERLIFEAEEALERALMDPVSHIVAFKSDPDKFRAFMESRGRENADA